MIYPQNLSCKKSSKLIKILLICSIIVLAILIIINKITSPNIPWAFISSIGIVYIWITVLYSIKKNTNIASHVLLQMIAISALMVYIDKALNSYGWSIHIGIPIVLIVANVTMLALAIFCHKKYIKYVIYQLIIVFLSLLQITFAFNGNIGFGILNKISIGISLFNFIISLILSYKEFYKIIVRKFHI